VMSGCQFRRLRAPHGGHPRDQVPRLPIDPAVPARLGPVDLGIKGSSDELCNCWRQRQLASASPQHE
jgi:hypothetical protein